MNFPFAIIGSIVNTSRHDMQNTQCTHHARIQTGGGGGGQGIQTPLEKSQKYRVP